jgi:hypothetical protein
VWPLVLIVALLIAAGLVLLTRRARVRRRGPPPTGAAAAFVTLVEALRGRGLLRRVHQTPSEYLQDIEGTKLLPADAIADAELVVRTFELERFSARTPDDEAVRLATDAATRVRELARR